ncbi:complement component C8 gamma chain isoform X2 [Fukomys damarensis]|uniref:complement component C8 gamma chain isoform X2 n=1 Tax=Fukomys damarensis TaxID=885580 RepID=UPI00053F93E1|nr:complement component C8 gamma chain isoform X2 [Fukomys damarensis]
MLYSRATLLLTLLLASGSLGQRARRPLSPISTTQPQANFDAQQEQGHRAEATALHATPQVAAMAVSTFRKLDGICWQVRQLYGDTGVPGRFLVPARGARGSVHVVVAETDYRDFAILYLERAQQLSMKLYGAWWPCTRGIPGCPALLTTARSLPVGDSALSVFEQRVRQANLTEDQTLFFPTYGHEDPRPLLRLCLCRSELRPYNPWEKSAPKPQRTPPPYPGAPSPDPGQPPGSLLCLKLPLHSGSSRHGTH